MALPPARTPSTIHLDYGADSAPFDPCQLRVCPNGLCLPTRWRFEPGTEIAFNFQLDEGDGRGPRLLRTVGIVVGCEPDGRGGNHYRLTLAFLEMTDDVRTLIRAMSDYHRRDGHARGKKLVPAREQPGVASSGGGEG